MTCALQIDLGVLGHLPNSAEQTCMSDDRELITSHDDFLASVENRAFIMARTSTGSSAFKQLYLWLFASLCGCQHQSLRKSKVFINA